MTAQLPFPQPHPLQAGPELRALRAQGPIHRIRTPVGDQAWLVTGYAQVRTLMDDDRLGRSHRSPQTAPRSRASALFGGPMGDFEAEPAGHRRMRELLQPHFSPRRLRSLASRVETLTEGLLDQLVADGSPADLHAKLALPLPLLVICELLGVPYRDRDRFRVWVDAAAFACRGMPSKDTGGGDAAIAGTSGNCGRRCLLVTPSALSRPARRLGMVLTRGANIRSTWPAMTSCTAGAVPL
jgi:pentalenolactone synthase